MAPLAGRRLGEMVELGERIAAIGLAVAMQAIRLRRPGSRGRRDGRKCWQPPAPVVEPSWAMFDHSSSWCVPAC